MPVDQNLATVSNWLIYSAMKLVGLVTAGDAFHERHAPALDGVGDQHLRPVGNRIEMNQGIVQRAEVVTVRAPHFPSERAELLFNRTQIAYRGDGGIRLELVVIDDRDNFGKPFVGDRLQRFPDLAFLQFAVTGEDDDLSAAALLRRADAH